MGCNLNLLINFIREKERQDVTSLHNEIAIIFAWREDSALLAVEELAITRGFIARDLKGLKLVGAGPLIENKDAFFFKSASTRNRDCDHTEGAYYCPSCEYWVIGSPTERLKKDGHNQALIHWCKICGDKIGRHIL